MDKIQSKIYTKLSVVSDVWIRFRVRFTQGLGFGIRVKGHVRVI